MQVVYHANYFVWFEVGRCELLRSVGWSYRDLEATGVLLPVIDAHCEYRRSARYDDDLMVVTHGRLLSPARVQFEYEVHRTADAVVTAIGSTVHAAVNAQGRPTRLPAPIKEMLA
jgi:acyl-CoA thioester hydrolase